MRERQGERKEAVVAVLRFEFMRANGISRLESNPLPEDCGTGIEIRHQWDLRYVCTVLERVSVKKDISSNRADLKTGEQGPGQRVKLVEIREIRTVQ